VKKLEKDLGLERELREKYHTEVEALRGRIRVLCRVHRSASFQNDDKNHDNDALNVSERSVRVGDVTYDFDHVVTNEETLWKRANLESLVESAVDGYNMCACTYGTSSSFKSSTMFNRSQSLLVNISASLFKRIHRDRREVNVSIVAVEICGQRILDMLRPSKSAWGNGNIYVACDERSGYVKIRNATSVRVKNSDEMIETCTNALRRRGMINSAAESSNDKYKDTSVIISVSIQRSDETLVDGKITLVDLADSDTPRIHNDDLSLDNSRSNLRALTKITEALSKNDVSKTLIPYKNDLLTNCLQDCIGGNAKTCFVVCVDSEKSNLNHTINAFEYSRKIRDVRNETHRIADLETIIRLQNELKTKKK